jgi:hypothetical protein
MDVLLQKTLPTKRPDTELIWIYSEKPDVYQKFSQYVEKKIEEPKHLPTEVVQQCVENTTTNTKNVQNISKKSKKMLPLELVMQLSETNDIEYIKSKFQLFISQKEFSSVFGVKKCSEIMTGITNNKWNKSLVIFLSFFFDAKFIYLNKEVVYDADKCTGNVINI